MFTAFGPLNPTMPHYTSRLVRRLSAHPSKRIFHFSWDCPLLGTAAQAKAVANGDKPKLAHASAATLSNNPNLLHINE